MARELFIKFAIFWRRLTFKKLILLSVLETVISVAYGFIFFYFYNIFWLNIFGIQLFVTITMYFLTNIKRNDIKSRNFEYSDLVEYTKKNLSEEKEVIFVPDIICNSLEDFEYHIPFHILYSILCEYESTKIFAIYENKKIKLIVRLNAEKKLVFFF